MVPARAGTIRWGSGPPALVPRCLRRSKTSGPGPVLGNLKKLLRFGEITNTGANQVGESPLDGASSAARGYTLHGLTHQGDRIALGGPFGEEPLEVLPLKGTAR
jgi:hypothetical protein